LNLKVTKGGIDIKIGGDGKVKELKVRREVDVKIGSKVKGLKVKDLKTKEREVEINAKVKESKVSGEVDVEVDIDGKEKRGIHFPKIGGKKKGSKSKSSSLSSKDPKEHKELQKSLLAEKLACLQKKVV